MCDGVCVIVYVGVCVMVVCDGVRVCVMVCVCEMVCDGVFV